MTSLKFSACFRGLILSLLLLTAAVSCKREPEVPVNRYPLRGEIVALDHQAHSATIRHERIGDWMEAMTMEFPVRDEAAYAKLAVGDQITGTVFVQDVRFWVAEIHVVGHSSTPR